MKIVASLYIFTLVVVGCSSSTPDPVQKHQEIKMLEDSLSSLSMKLDQKLDTSMINRLKNKLINFYQTFPENEYAPEYLDKLHMLAIREGNYETGLRYADTLVENYNKYVNRAMVLESMANAYDMFVQPRDTSKVRYYNNLLLKENPKMNKEKREEIEFRMKHLDLTFDQLIDLQIDSLVEK